MPDHPSILAVTSELPWPLDTGGHLRTFHLLRSLASRFHVRLVAGVRRRDQHYLPHFEDARIQVCAAWLPDRRPPLLEAVRAAAAAVRRDPYVLYRRHDRPALHEVVAREIASQAPDVLYLDHLDSFLFARHNRRSRVVLDLHNVYSRLVDRMATDPSAGRFMRRYLAREAGLLARIETSAVRSADQVFSVSDDEQRHFSALRGRPVVLVPNGVDCGLYAPLPVGRRSAPPTVLFIGTLSWAPNVEAVRFLATHVLPEIRRAVPDATLTIVGRDPAPEIRRLAAQQAVTVAGSVPDVVPYLRDAAMLAVPLESGGGTRLKILESFAAGLPVVSTPIGCEGLDVTDGRELLVATRQRFAEAVRELLVDRSRGEALAGRARAVAQARYDWPVVGAQAIEAIARLLS